MDHAQAVAEVATPTFTLTPTDTTVLQAVLAEYQTAERVLAEQPLSATKRRSSG